MLNNLTKLVTLVLVLSVGFLQAQDSKTKQQLELKVVTGNEVVDLSSNPVIKTQGNTVFGPVSAGGLTFNVHNITDVQSGYDLQSNGSTQQVWLHPDMPDFIHAAFTNSQVSDGAWADRTSLYFGSTDFGESWFELGGVPINNGTTGRSGFPAINGLSTGAAVISNHNNADQTTVYSTVFIDNGPLEYNFTNYSPGAPTAGATIWSRLAVTDNDDVVLAASINGGTDFYVNTLSVPTFSGWQLHNGDQAETYSLAVSDGGKIGLAYLGQASAAQDFDVLYKESTDGGLTWSTTPIVVWDAIADPLGDAFGCIRGVSVNFYGEDPCVVFEAGWNNIPGGTFSPGLPSEIRFWSPIINGGVSKAIADSSNVPFWPMYGTNDVQYPLSRPVIGRSQSLDYLFVGFNATTGEYWPGVAAGDSTAYCAGYFTYSSDGGDTWISPERFTPTSPLRDWRYVSIAPVNPVAPADDDNITVHFVMQGDSLPGSAVNAVAPMPVGVTAQYYHFSGDLLVVSANDPVVVNEFSLEQNYPNPFNPNTSINYTLAEAGDVSLKVFDILGREVATLVNSTQNAGSYNLTFDASELASGLYIYTLKAGNFVSSKKMMLLK